MGRLSSSLAVLCCCVVITTLLVRVRTHPGAGARGGASGRSGSQGSAGGPLDGAALRGELSAERVIATATSSPLYDVRVPGTAAHKRVLRWLKKELARSGAFQVSTHSFTDSTPRGRVRFTNVIASTRPAASRRIVLAAHYDSKIFDEFEFHGAVDSAVPVAMLLELAAVLGPAVAGSTRDVALEIVLFDGEEAVEEWTASDSLYGSRALAAKWETEGRLAGIDVFVLLDLIGSGTHVFHNAHKRGRWAFDELVAVEGRGRRDGWISDHQAVPYFKPEPSRMTVQDDHVPFAQRKVPVVHMIPIPFPRVWHTADDAAPALQVEPVADILALLTQWLVEYGLV